MWGMIGAGGHSKVAVDIITEQEPNIQFCLFHNGENLDPFFTSFQLYDDNINLIKEKLSIIDSWHVAIGSISTRREKINLLKDLSAKVKTIIHPSSFISKYATVSYEGSLVNVHAVINANAYVGTGCIINTSASIDHDCYVSDYVNIGPGVRLAGNVRIERESELGAGVTVIPNKTIGKNCLIGAGAVIIEDIPDYSVAVGVPAKVITTIKPIK
ncbi:transferase [Bacillus cereus]|nr:transferase [Bacillus cereus]